MTRKLGLTGVSILIVFATLAACGGGGGGGGSAARPSGFAYVANFTSNNVSAYTAVSMTKCKK